MVGCQCCKSGVRKQQDLKFPQKYPQNLVPGHAQDTLAKYTDICHGFWVAFV